MRPNFRLAYFSYEKKENYYVYRSGGLLFGLFNYSKRLIYTLFYSRLAVISNKHKTLNKNRLNLLLKNTQSGSELLKLNGLRRIWYQI